MPAITTSERFQRFAISACYSMLAVKCRSRATSGGRSRTCSALPSVAEGERWKRIGDPRERAGTLAAIASETVEKGVRNVAILDYYCSM